MSAGDPVKTTEISSGDKSSQREVRGNSSKAFVRKERRREGREKRRQMEETVRRDCCGTHGSPTAVEGSRRIRDQ